MGIRFDDPGIASSMKECLQAITQERKSLAVLHETKRYIILYQHQLKKEAQQDNDEDKTRKGAMRAPFGCCPECLFPGVHRNRKEGGVYVDTCENGHTYSSKTAITTADAMRKARERERNLDRSEAVKTGKETGEKVA